MNILLIGFKASGKSSTGAALARLSGKNFVDTDALVEKLYQERFGAGRSCREIAAGHGQGLLRELETEALRKVAEFTDTVVATGGGIVLRDENLPLLRQSGLCVFLDTPLPKLEKRLASQADSPLFKERSVREVYEERYPRYLKAAGLRYVPADGDGPEAVAEAVLRALLASEKTFCNDRPLSGG